MTDITNLSTVNVAISNYIAVVTMNNPPVNAQNRQFHDDLTLAFDVLSDRNDVRSIVLTGAGKCFSAGADIKGRASQESDLGDHILLLFNFEKKYFEKDKVLSKS